MQIESLEVESQSWQSKSEAISAASGEHKTGRVEENRDILDCFAEKQSRMSQFSFEVPTKTSDGPEDSIIKVFRYRIGGRHG